MMKLQVMLGFGGDASPCPAAQGRAQDGDFDGPSLLPSHLSTGPSKKVCH